MSAIRMLVIRRVGVAIVELDERDCLDEAAVEIRIMGARELVLGFDDGENPTEPAWCWRCPNAPHTASDLEPTEHVRARAEELRRHYAR